ncbi:MAG: ABC transporter substrate-binding protein, partial [Chloroflexota bacterium]
MVQQLGHTRRGFLKQTVGLGAGLAGVSVLAEILAACGGGSAASPAASAGSSGAAPSSPAAAKPAASAASQAAAGGGNSAPLERVTALVLGNPPLVGFFEDDVAHKFGIFKQFGLDVTLQHIGSPSSVIQALVAGKVDFAKTTVLSLYQAASRGQAVKIIDVEEVRAPFQLVVAADIKSASDLKGKTYASGAIYGADYYFTDTILRSAGLSIKDMKVVVLGTGPAKTDALISGKVAATAVLFDQVPIITRNGPGLHVLNVSPSQYQTYFPMDTIAVTEAYLKTHTETAIKFVKAILTTLRSLHNDQAFFTKAVEALHPGSFKPAEIKQNWETFRKLGYWGLNGGLNLKDL